MHLPPIDCLIYPSHPPLPQSSTTGLPVAAATAAAATAAAATAAAATAAAATVVYPDSIMARGSGIASARTSTQAPSLLTDYPSTSASSSSGYTSAYGSCSSASASASASAPASAPTSPPPSSPLLCSSSPQWSSSPSTPAQTFSPLASSSSASTTLSLPALNRIIRRVLRRPKIRVVRIAELSTSASSSSILPRYLLTLSSSPDDPPCTTQHVPQLMLTLPPRSHTKLLRIEQKALETEVSVYQILGAHSDVKVPRVLAYDLTAKTLKGTPFILTTVLPGGETQGSGGCLADTDQMQRLVDRIGRVKSSASVFGPLYRFSSSLDNKKSACTSWRQAFNLLLEGALRDGEDMLVSLPYEAIRTAFRRFSGALDHVRESRLVLLGLGVEDDRASVVLDDENRDEIAGLIGCGGWVIWGDPLMAKIFGGKDILEEAAEKDREEYSDDKKDRKML
ncbi:MAG: hypothetical protein M1816_000843 [Peltula sp. TS41687]|nr:MAG: hypothetical protein M1816_000843 [Peltula sp. TS41687]